MTTQITREVSVSRLTSPLLETTVVAPGPLVSSRELPLSSAPEPSDRDRAISSSLDVGLHVMAESL